MKPQVEHFYEFGPFRLATHERVLLREGRPVLLTPKAFDCLLVLVESSGHIIEKDELMTQVWPDTFVQEMNLARHVSTLRKVLGDGSDDPHYIETIPKRGYRFVALVREIWDGGAELIVEEHISSSISIEEEEELYDLKGIPSASAPTALPESIGMEEPSAPLSSVKIEAAPATKARRAVQLAIVGALVVMATIFWLYKYLSKPALPFQQLRMAKLTNTGNASDSVISPDGKFIAYVVNDSGHRSIWVRQFATSGNIQIVPPTGNWLGGLSFSPDNNHVAYGRSDGKNPSGLGLFQVPVLGGPSRKLMELVSSPITFSPEGKRFAFIRRYPSQGETTLIIANADGTGEEKIATRNHPDFFGAYPSKPAWSPDGKTIACAAGRFTVPGYRMNVVEVRLEDGAEKPISSHNWRWIRGLAWLSDGSGLVMTALEYQERMTGSGTNNFQLWYLSYPSGESRKITNDSNDYVEISATADSDTLVTSQVDAFQNIWIAPNADAPAPKQITSGVSKYSGISWMPDGRIAYASITTGNPDIWIMDADGNNQRQLTADARANSNPSVSPDGRYIVFYSTRAGTHIWRMDIDGGNPKQLTNGVGEYFPQCSPDGKWVVYQESSPVSKPTLWKVHIDGGEPTQLNDEHSMFPVVSPDGKLIAYVFQDERANPNKGLAVIPFEGGRPIKRLARPSGARPFIRWTMEGRALAYVDTCNSISNIFSQPLDGGPPKQLTDFTSDEILWFDWSRDGNKLACVRGIVINDIVIVSNLR